MDWDWDWDWVGVGWEEEEEIDHAKIQSESKVLFSIFDWNSTSLNSQVRSFGLKIWIPIHFLSYYEQYLKVLPQALR